MNLQELKQIKERGQYKMGTTKPRIVVNMGTSGIYAGVGAIVEAVKDELHKRHLHVDVAHTGTLGIMSHEPLMEVITPGTGRIVYGKVTPEKARTIIANHLVNHQPVYEWAINLC